MYGDWVFTTAVVPVIIMGYLYNPIIRKLWSTKQLASVSYKKARQGREGGKP